jgi:hypothetical protein
MLILLPPNFCEMLALPTARRGGFPPSLAISPQVIAR